MMRYFGHHQNRESLAMSHDQDQPSERDHTLVKTILIVEDDADIGEFLERVISDETPYHALLVSNGFEALKITYDLKPDLLLLDYQLPGMNGIELYDRLHTTREREALPAIMLSAHLPKQELEKRKMVGLEKPIELPVLLEAVEQALADHDREP